MRPSGLHAPIPGVPAAEDVGTRVLRAVVESLADHALDLFATPDRRLYVSVLASPAGTDAHGLHVVRGLPGVRCGVPPNEAVGALADAAHDWARCSWPGQTSASRWWVHVDLVRGPAHAVGYALLVVAHGAPHCRVFDVARTVIRWQLGAW